MTKLHQTNDSVNHNTKARCAISIPRTPVQWKMSITMKMVAMVIVWSLDDDDKNGDENDSNNENDTSTVIMTAIIDNVLYGDKS